VNKAVMLLAVALWWLPAASKDKHAPTPRVYDQTATLSFSSFADSSASITDSEGNTHNAYCNFYGTHAECSEGVGAGWFLTLPNGAGDAIVEEIPIDLDHYDKLMSDYKSAAQDPLREVIHEIGSDPQHRPQQIAFRWRIRAIGGMTNFVYICLPLNPLLPRSGIGSVQADKHDTEACYHTAGNSAFERSAFSAVPSANVDRKDRW
jgi:hypothetical protein